ncbi:MAG: Na+/H+ antiporter NhaA [Acidimicrobiales bacterium]|nr:Na+/H+ antiporter NhaA [Acidimicrobiales bacterium]
MPYSNHEPSPLTFIGSDRRVARRIARPLQQFLHVEAASGILLLAATAIALLWVNVPLFGDSYHDFWETKATVSVGEFYSLDGHEPEAEGESHGAEGGESHGAEGAVGEGESEAAAEDGSEAVEAHDEEHSGITLHGIVNDILMVLFFFVVGMEIKLELVSGQLRDRSAAVLPAMAALGGMIVPAAIFFALNPTGPESAGWGIPMATDIAFALGVVSLLGSRVPAELKVFLLTLAVVDDIGAILVIAIFYTSGLSVTWLLIGVALLGLMYGMQRLRVWWIPIYVIVGMFIWLAVFESGVHATIAGVAIGLLTPARPLQQRPRLDDLLTGVFQSDEVDTTAPDVKRAEFELRETVSVAERLSSTLHPLTSYVIIPVFALANAGISLSGDGISDAASSRVTLGIVMGLVVGKLVGVSFFTYLATRLKLSKLPANVSFGQVLGICAVSGIGFTVSIFITTLAYSDAALQEEAKMGILVASLFAAVLGLAMLHRAASNPNPPNPNQPGVDAATAPTPEPVTAPKS